MDEAIQSGLIVAITILLFTALVSGVVYFDHKLKVDNFQATLTELSDEQKCLYICSFRYSGSTYFDQYKFCIEKCDRISERDQKCAKIS